MEGPFHVFFRAILDLKTSKTTIKTSNEEVLVRLVWKADKLDWLNTKQGRRIHAKHAVFNTFILGPGSLGCLNWRSKLRWPIQWRCVSMGHWDILPFRVLDIEPVICVLFFSLMVACPEFLFFQQVT